MVIYCLLSSEILHDSVDNTVHNHSEEHREQSVKPPILNEQCFSTQANNHKMSPVTPRVMIFHSHVPQNQISTSLLTRQQQKNNLKQHQQNRTENRKKRNSVKLLLLIATLLLLEGLSTNRYFLAYL